MKDLLCAALGLSSPWFIEDVRFDSDLKRLDIDIRFKRGHHFSHDGVDYPVRDTMKKSWRHLNFFEHECYLHARVPRIKTSDGGIVTMMPPWSGKLSGFTLLFEAFLLEFCHHMPVDQVSKITGVGNGRLWRLLDLYVESARFDEDWSKVNIVGMDETSIAKGHDYITLFVDLVERRTLHIAEGKGSDTVQDFTTALSDHGGNACAIEEVSCDMSPAFIKGTKDYLPNASITFDKFHILKIINEGVDQVRRQEAKDNPLLKNTRYIFLKNKSNLTKKQKDKREELEISSMNLQSMEALRMRENFQAIYFAQSTEQFARLLCQWILWLMDCGLKPMEKVAKTMINHFRGIVRWKKSQINNGILEGLNSVIQAAKRKARGYKARHFATIAYLITSRLEFQKINRYWKHT